ncbi:MAG: tetratricopeptide repeat protein [Bacteroidetes bacterium]|nr:tetratricopeptide repeat protein [Bacteroidota bacterium]
MKTYRNFIHGSIAISISTVLCFLSCSPIPTPMRHNDDFFTPYEDFTENLGRSKYYSLLTRKLIEARMEFLDNIYELVQQQTKEIQHLQQLLSQRSTAIHEAVFLNEQEVPQRESRRQWQSKLEKILTELRHNITQLKNLQQRAREYPHHVQAAQHAVVRVDAKPIDEVQRSHQSVTYEKALRYYTEKKYERALGAFNVLLSSTIAESLKDNCHFWSGVCYFQLGKVSKAIQSFLTVIQLPSSDKRDAALFMLGQCYEHVGNRVLAESAYQMLLQQHPYTTLRYIAKQKLLTLR